ncbi:MAG: uncharacterized protein A8A55_2384 [Amphiamblys sp. WSBS2006]|nr:MAG: uncharacterized protein A8A55_2384 [Amphiamblys sp. WSBS2006]
MRKLSNLLDFSAGKEKGGSDVKSAVVFGPTVNVQAPPPRRRVFVESPVRGRFLVEESGSFTKGLEGDPDYEYNARPSKLLVGDTCDGKVVSVIGYPSSIATVAKGGALIRRHLTDEKVFLKPGVVISNPNIGPSRVVAPNGEFRAPFMVSSVEYGGLKNSFG